MSSGDQLKLLEEQKAQKHIKKLRSQVSHYEKLYREGKPEITDWEFDMLVEQLRSLEQKYPQFQKTSSPTQKVGDDRSGSFPTVAHIEPMLSLENSYSKDELWAFDSRLKRALESDVDFEYVVEPKIDGVAISVVYENGQLVRALTRGNGQEGDEVTENFKQVVGCQTQLDTSIAQLELRGEIYLSYADFERINQQRESEGKDLYANPRNLAAGTLKLKDNTKEVARRGLKVIFYGVGACSDSQLLAKQEAVLEFIQTQKLPCHHWWQKSASIEAAWSAIEQLDKLRKTFEYPTDGAVLKLNLRSLQQQAGFTARAPRWAFAYKFNPEQAQTLLEKIDIQVGRTGVLTPVAHLSPVELSGSTVSRATLHNADEIERKDIRVGDTVIIEKAGEVIPAVVKVVEEKRPANSQPFIFPQRCPACNGMAVRLEGEVAWRCINSDCPEIRKQALEHFASRNAMDIDGLGEAVVKQLIEAKAVETPADLYHLRASDLYEMEYFRSQAADVKKGQEYKTLMVNNLLEGIDRSKRNDLWRLLHGLGIAQVGEGVAQLLAREFRSLEALAMASMERLCEIKGVGESMAACITEFFGESKNKALIAALQKYGVNTLCLEDPREEGPLTGEKFVLTGNLSVMTRKQAKGELEKLGATVIDSVSKNTTAVVAGEKAGSKLKKAQELGIKIYNESEFVALLENGNEK